MKQKTGGWLARITARLPKKKRYYVGGAILVLIVIVAVSGGRDDAANATEAVTRGDVVRTVLATGQVKSDVEVELSLTTGGIVRSVPVAVGDKVVRGQALLSLDTGTLQAERARAYADVLLARAQMKNSEVSLDAVTRQQETLVSSAKRTMLSTGLVAVPSSSSYGLEAPVITGSYGGDEGEYKLIIKRQGAGRDYELRTFGIENTVVEIDEEEATPLGTQGLYVSFPEESIGVYDDTIWYVTIPNAKSSSYIANYNAYQEAIRTRNKAIVDAEAQLADRTAGGSIAAAELAKAEAELARIDAELAKHALRAPYDGTITRVDVKAGELVNAYDPIIVLEDLGALYIEADVNESNATNIVAGQQIAVTYDAFGPSDVRMATVDFVDPSATIVDGIVNYRIKALIADDANVKPGMTANLSVETGRADDVLMVPSRVVLDRDGEKVVSVVTDARRGKTEIRTITTGLRGDGSMVEVISGLAEGDLVKALEIK